MLVGVDWKIKVTRPPTNPARFICLLQRAYMPIENTSTLTHTHIPCIRTLAAIFQTNFVTPDLLTIAAEKVFSHRIELKSTRRQRMLAAATGGLGSSSVSSPSSPYRNNRSSLGRNNGKTPLRGTRQTPPHISRKGSTGSEASGSIGGDSFVEHSSDSEGGSSHAGGGRGGSGDDGDGGSVVDGRGGGDDDDGASEVADETTAADVVREVLRVVYPPI